MRQEVEEFCKGMNWGYSACHDTCVCVCVCVCQDKVIAPKMRASFRFPYSKTMSHVWHQKGGRDGRGAGRVWQR